MELLSITWPYLIISLIAMIAFGMSLSQSRDVRTWGVLMSMLTLFVCGLIIVVQRESTGQDQTDWQQAAAPLVEQRLPMLDRKVHEITAEDVANALNPCFVRDYRERGLPSTPGCRDHDRETRVAVSLVGDHY